ncbi:ferric iron reductase protein FhuF [Anoxybacillus vitaminiphilus]|uniref:Ferric iron reductase protein FhuF n=1 Tax=Paranoxybacillus vitaminiphilus TaxID=581036 RepID=A0A327Y8W7_9BACL|nr:IucA/IucC family C-terminal-domain containing protein [Anoxybacillus vitaminiphilus]RAK16612.1 ferric iron reductase protein FhuF [Anoxybacillus vitaminiphilus]
MMFSESEIAQLKKFRLSTEETNSPLSVRLDQLLCEDRLTAYLEMLRERIHAPNKAVAASMFMKRYSFLLIMSLYAMSVWNKSIHFDFKKIWMESEDENKVWMPTFRFETLEYTKADNDRQSWRKQVMTDLFANHTYVLVEVLADVSKLSKRILWENVAIYIFWLYESLMEDEKFAAIHDHLFADFHFIVQEAEGSLFGAYHKNPLFRFWKEKTFSIELQKEIRVRTTCCLYYQTAEDGARCQTCPCRV